MTHSKHDKPEHSCSGHDHHGEGGSCDAHDHDHGHNHDHDHDHKHDHPHPHPPANDNPYSHDHDHKHDHKHDHNCGHDHHDHHDHDHGHHHHDHDHHHHDHDHDHKEVSYNNGILKYAFSKVSGRAGEWLNKHRKKIVLGAAAATAAVEYSLTNSTMFSSLALLFAGAAIAHDASEDIMEVTGELKKTQNLSSGVVGTAVGATHTLAEAMFSLSSTLQGNSDIAVSSVMGSNASHILLMAGGAAVIGSVGKGQSTTWKMHALGVAGLTGAFGYQIATGEFNPYLGAAMAGGGLYYLWNRVKTGETCAIHGDACSGDDHNHDHDHDHGPAEPLTLKSRLTDPKLLQLGGSVAALTAGAHVLGDQILVQAQDLGISETTAGAGIAALALAAPEIILTWKAAHKGDTEMAWGAVTGCTVATVGIVGGALAMSGVPVPINLDPTTSEGMMHMAAFGGSAAAIVAATHPKVISKISKDGSSIPKWLGGAFLAAAVTYYANSALTSCHFDFRGGEMVEHCSTHGASDDLLLPDATLPPEFFAQ